MDSLKSVVLGACAIGSLAAPLVPATAQSGPETMYNRVYYADAAKTMPVGYEYDRCTRYGVEASAIDGQYSVYVDELPVATCVNGKIESY